MLGAIIGDFAGSIYEFNQFSSVKKVKIKNLIEKNSFFSDDTVLTVAVADAILSGCEYEKKIKEWGLKYKNYMPNFSPYFKTFFSPNFEKWLEGAGSGTSAGNGAMMRISPVGFLFSSENEVIQNAKLATASSHNSKSATHAATLVALTIFYFRQGLSKKEVIKKLGIKIKKPKIKTFNITCDETVDVCFYCLFKSNSFEESLKKTISFGGDTDTNACIVGSMAEARFGLDEKLKNQVLQKLPSDMLNIVSKFYKQKNHKKIKITF